MSTPPSDGPSPSELRRQARLYAALVSAFGRTETLLADLAACADPEEASLLLQRQLDIDEESAGLVLSMQVYQFPAASRTGSGRRPSDALARPGSSRRTPDPDADRPSVGPPARMAANGSGSRR